MTHLSTNNEQEIIFIAMSVKLKCEYFKQTVALLSATTAETLHT